MNYKKPTAEEALDSGSILHIKPQGNSMLPLIKEGRDSVYIKKVSFEQVKKGEIVLYRNEHHLLVLHRICKKTPTAFYTVGDNQLLSAGPYPREALLGKITAMERKGYIKFGQKPLYVYGKLWLLRRTLLLVIRKLIKSIRHS